MTQNTTEADGPSLSIDPSDAANVLVRSSGIDAIDRRVCHDLLSIANPTATSVLALEFWSGRDRTAEWDQQVGDRPASMRVLAPDGTTRSVAHADPDGGATNGGVDRIEDVTDLMEVGLRLSEAFSELAVGDGPTTFCFH